MHYWLHCKGSVIWITCSISLKKIKWPWCSIAMLSDGYTAMWISVLERRRQCPWLMFYPWCFLSFRSWKRTTCLSESLGFFVINVDAVQCKCTQSVLYYWRCAVYCRVLSRCSFYEHFKWTGVFVQGHEKIMRRSRAFAKFHWFTQSRTWVCSIFIYVVMS